MIPGWLDEVTEEVSRCLEASGRISALGLAEMLGISERTAVGYIALLAARGRVIIDSVSLPEGPGATTPDREGGRPTEGSLAPVGPGLLPRTR
jgi:hypothetical protein